MDDEQLNGRRTARHGAAAMPAETVITEERPAMPAGRDSGAAPAAAMDQYTRRRLAAEAAADAAEAAAAEAASRAAAAIKAAARAAEEAEAAADAAARAADDVLVAAEAESRAQAAQVSSVPPPWAPNGHPTNGHPANGQPHNGRAVNGRGPNGHALNGHAVAEAPPLAGRVNGHPDERSDDTTVIPPVRVGGRRRRQAEDTAVEESGHAVDAEPEVPAEVTAVVPPTRDRSDGRAARRRAQEAAAAVALEASRDPVTDAITVMEPVSRPVQDAATQVVPARHGEFDEYGRDDFDRDDFDVDPDFADGRRVNSLVDHDLTTTTTRSRPGSAGRSSTPSSACW